MQTTFKNKTEVDLRQTNYKLLQDSNTENDFLKSILFEYHILVSNDNGNIGTVKITNEICEIYGTGEYELHNISLCNTERLFPQTFRKMEDVMMREMLETPELMTDEEKEILDGMFAPANIGNSSMYVLSNKEGVDGAALCTSIINP